MNLSYEKEYIKTILNRQTFAFNVWDVGTAKAIIDASVLKQIPVFLQISAKVFDCLDKEEFIYAVKRYRKISCAEIIIHLDHCRNIEQIKEAVLYGWDSVMYDGSCLLLDENIRVSNEVANICRKSKTLMEVEIGQIGGKEDGIYAEAISSVGFSDIEKFIDKVNMDMLAVDVGTLHGLYDNNPPKINFEIIRKIGAITNTPIVVHGGSGLSDLTLSSLLACKNVKKINISTDVKQAYRKGVIKALDEGLMNEKGFDAIKVNKYIYNSIRLLALSKLGILERDIV